MKYNTIEDFIKRSNYYINDIDYDDHIFNINVTNLAAFSQTIKFKATTLAECKEQLLKWANENLR